MGAVRRAIAFGFAGVLLGACATTPPEKASLDALKWDAARECEWRFASVNIGRPDVYGRLPAGGRIKGEVHRFKECYREHLRAKTSAAAETVEVEADVPTASP